MANTVQDGGTAGEISIPVRFDVPDDVVTRFATNFTVQYTDEEFIIGFYEVRPPILLGTPEENVASLSSMDGLAAHCVARLVVTPARMAELVQTLTASHENYAAGVRGGDDDAER